MNKKKPGREVKKISENIETKSVVGEEIGSVYLFRDVLNSWESDIREWWYSTSFVIWWLDIINFFRFIKEIKEEEKDSESIFNKLKFKTNKFRNVVYRQYNFSDNEFMWADYDVQKMVVNKYKEFAKYFYETIMWGEYIITDIMNFSTAEGEPTMTYVYMFKYSPKLFTFKGLFKWMGIILCGCGLLVLLVWLYILTLNYIQ